ncbi:MAG TPA: methylated-DNA--[protein]-cysteine S-methyltransferase [Daejeonella sp.]|nr:methylated-DNA--[protein]-cysteine S-methyltransferase [Daejeonella sp.]
MYSSVLSTEIGQLVIRANNEAVFFIGFPEELPEELPNELSMEACQQLKEYFDGKRHRFSFHFEQEGTDFQKSVWKELLKVEAGYPISYMALSKKMNNPLAIRAIAAANGRNNLMIVVPCHRIIGNDGKLVGYAGGLWRKKWLLEHESRMMKMGQGVLEF